MGSWQKCPAHPLSDSPVGYVMLRACSVALVLDCLFRHFIDFLSVLDTLNLVS